jgi:hypothetical protein
MKNIKPYLILFIGEILLITSFFHFGKNLNENVLVLNICVSSIIYLLIFSSFLFPLLDFKDKTQSTVASLGINWLITLTYTISALVLMLFFSLPKSQEFKIETQILIHFILLFLLLIGGFISNKASDKVTEVFHEQNAQRSKLIEIQKVSKNAISRIELMNGISPELKFRLNNISEDLRYVSPSNSVDALDIESTLLAMVNRINDLLYHYENNKESIELTVKQCEKLIKERKQVYSI